MRQLAPRSGPLPFAYALSNGTPMYRRLPTPEEWRHEERFYDAPGSYKPLSWGNRGHERLAVVRSIAPSSPVSPFLADGGSVARRRARSIVRREIPLGSMLAYTSSFEHAGRTWLQSADGTVVPADRVRPFRVTDFHGVELRNGLRLPLAWMRKRPRPQYVFEAGRFLTTGKDWPKQSFVALDSERNAEVRNGDRFLPTREAASGRTLWIREADATIAAPVEKLPWGVGEHDKWITLSITRGTLVAYEGRKAVFATLISPGAGGVPIRGRDPAKMSTTPMGTYRVTFKHASQTMSPGEGIDERFWIAEVPHTQYFSAPFALHTAYWHDDFGEPMSAGCVNLAPLDGLWLFGWTTPQLPPGWAGVAQHELTGKGTHVIVRR
jgi:lipoprotein-anchoring transpeptidase ErfK/SrfK